MKTFTANQSRRFFNLQYTTQMSTYTLHLHPQWLGMCGIPCLVRLSLTAISITKAEVSKPNFLNRPLTSVESWGGGATKRYDWSTAYVTERVRRSLHDGKGNGNEAGGKREQFA